MAPRKRGRRRRPGSVSWTPELHFHLSTGGYPPGFPLGTPPGEYYFTDTELAAGWGLYAERVLALEEPGGRPVAWWYFEGPDELRGSRPVLVDADDTAARRQHDVTNADLASRRAMYLREHPLIAR